MSKVNNRVDYEKSPNLPTRGKARHRGRECGVSFTRGRVSLALLSLRKNGDYSQSNNREAFKKICVLVNGCAKIYTLRFRPRCQCRYYKKGSKLGQRAEICALLPDLAQDKTISAKTINKKIKPFKGVTPIMCMIELDMVGAQQGWEQYKVGQGWLDNNYSPKWRWLVLGIYRGREAAR